MVFSSLYFLFLYLPIVLLVYYLTPLKWRNLWLLVVNLVFYGWGEPVYILLMIFTIVLDYYAGILVARCKAKGNDRGARWAVGISLGLNLAILFFFKYWVLMATTLQHFGLMVPTFNLTLPIGISFYTFQTMTYPVDIYRGDAELPKNLVSFGTFVTLFPQLIAGPIIKYKELADQMNYRTHSPEQFASGVQVFTVGLAKKVLLANNIGKLWDAFLALPADQLTTAGAWLGVVAFSFQLYFDFSGYSDMAVGLGRMLGFEFLRNFNYPYISKSVTEFWRRWHISLGSWFREYMYIPLGGNRVSKPRLYLNLFLVWAATGIWHGASWNFLIWGLYFAVLIILEKAFLGRLLEKLPAAVQHIYTLFLVLVSWAIFAVEDFTHMGAYLRAMFGMAPGGLTNDNVWYYFTSFLPMLIIAAVASTPLLTNLWKRLPVKAVKIALPVVILGGLVFSTAYLVDATYNPFLYFRF